MSGNVKRTASLIGLAMLAVACVPEATSESVNAESEVAMVAADDAPTIKVYKSPSCGCCAGWVEHMLAAGFKVEVVDTENLAAIRAEAGIPPQLQSCHTAFAGDYVFEGHVPAEVIARFLAQKSAAKGLAVPGMPMGSPGMEMGGQADPYDVIAFDEQGRTAVYESR